MSMHIILSVNQQMIMSAIMPICLSIAAIVLGIIFVCSTIPVRNEVIENKIIIHFALGNKFTIDISNAVFRSIPSETQKDLIRLGGTSLGKVRSGNFKNIKTGTKFVCFLTGNGSQIYFEVDEKKYLIDLCNEEVAKLKF